MRAAASVAASVSLPRLQEEPPPHANVTDSAEEKVWRLFRFIESKPLELVFDQHDQLKLQVPQPGERFSVLFFFLNIEMFWHLEPVTKIPTETCFLLLCKLRWTLSPRQVLLRSPSPTFGHAHFLFTSERREVTLYVFQM